MPVVKQKMICATITEKIIENMVDTANFSSADLVELRLDCLEKHTHLEKIGDVSKPVIVTCMPASEGGKFLGSEEDRGGILFETVKYADYVSLELLPERTAGQDNIRVPCKGYEGHSHIS